MDHKKPGINRGIKCLDPEHASSGKPVDLLTLLYPKVDEMSDSDIVPVRCISPMISPPCSNVVG